MFGGVPPGWPGAVHPPGEPGLRRTAVAWLLDLCPADYRGYPDLVRHPVVLAWLAIRHVAADLETCRSAVAAARAELGPLLEPAAITRVVAALETEEARLVTALRGARLIAQALGGRGGSGLT